MEKVAEKLDNINETLKAMLQTLNKPENKVMTVFKVTGAAVSALGFLSIIDIIRRWIIGG